jgi:hypothetical protein
MENTEKSLNTRFLGSQINKHLNWANQTDKMIHKLRAESYARRPMVYASNSDNLKSVYFAYFRSIMKYGNKFWG